MTENMKKTKKRNWKIVSEGDYPKETNKKKKQFLKKNQVRKNWRRKIYVKKKWKKDTGN